MPSDQTVQFCAAFPLHVLIATICPADRGVLELAGEDPAELAVLVGAAG